MKNLFLSTSTVALILGGSAAFAQSNEAFLEQVGNDNEASQTQTGVENVATVSQAGNGRDIHVQTGDRNSYTSTHVGPTWQRDGQQTGNDNTISLTTNGTGLWIPHVRQIGDNNVASLDVTGDAYYTLNQSGNRNNFAVTADGLGGDFQQNAVEGVVNNDNIGTMTAFGDYHSAYHRILGSFNIATINQTGLNQNGAQWVGKDYNLAGVSNVFTITQGGYFGYARQWLNGGDFNIATIDQSDAVNKDAQAHQTIEGDTNVALATQAGARNISSSRQTGNSNISVQRQQLSANTADLVQSGNANFADLTQNGSDNSATQNQDGNLNTQLSTQLGSTNVYEVVQTGLENNMTLSQIGVGLVAIATQTGNFNLGTQTQTGANHYASLVQTGDKNSATQIQN